MAFGNVDPRTASHTQSGVLYDEGLRSYMLRVYNYMGVGLAITGILAFVTAQLSVVTNDAGQIVGLTSLGNMLYASPLKWVVMLAPLAIVFAFAATVNRMSAVMAQGVFWLFAGLMGVSLSSILIVFTSESVAQVFFITAATFGAMSLFGYTTRRSLANWGSFLFMGLIGIIIAMIVNIFMQSEMLHFVISVIGVLVFTGLTAYDTQRIKESYSVHMSGEMASKSAIHGALRLYLDFINLFVMLIQLLGVARGE
ncbi:MAG: Bax inhibitor-1/YccA family protein [Rhodospirillales bacterium]|nr:Bax inhibitor-1/YccA family protein [Rhodospirillales bacterium]